MPLFEIVAGLVIAALAAGLALALAAAREASRRPGAAGDALARGDFAAALQRARPGPQAERSELFAAAVAAKHLLELDRAADLLEGILAADASDGEAWLERGLVAAYAGDGGAARRAFDRAAALRSDLAEPLALHRAWLELAAGDLRRASQLFEEVAVPLENKFRIDLGTGDPLFAEWLLQAGVLWRALGDRERGAWAWGEGKAAAPRSRLPEVVGRPARGRGLP